MLSFPAAIRVYLCTVACDMRRSFDGLAMMAEHIVQCSPLSGHLLVFCNKRSDRLKILYWDRDGWVIWYKRIEAGTFDFPFATTGRREIAAWELGVLLGGIDLAKGRRRKRYARRRFFEAQTSDIRRSMAMMAYIHRLYDIERQAAQDEMTATERLALRRERALPILDDMKSYLDRERPQVRPKSPIGQAISYALSNWDALVRYCDDGDLGIDNNQSERSLRGFAVGRHNWTFFGSDNGGHTAAILVSLIESAKRHHLDPFAYLRDILQRLSTHPRHELDQLLPDHWQTPQAPAS